MTRWTHIRPKKCYKTEIWNKFLTQTDNIKVWLRKLFYWKICVYDKNFPPFKIAEVFKVLSHLIRLAAIFGLAKLSSSVQTTSIRAKIWFAKFAKFALLFRTDT